MAAHRRKRSQCIETMESMVLMSASAADVDFAALDAGTAGEDLLFSTEAGGNVDGSAGDDILIGAAGDNLLGGGEGDDVLVSVRGDNVLNGGNGNDLAVYLNGNRADYEVRDFGFGGIVEVRGAGRADLLNSVERVRFNDGVYSIADLVSGAGTGSPLGISSDPESTDISADELALGTAGTDVLAASGAGQSVNAGHGRDLVAGIAGDNELLGGDGDDTFVTWRGDNTVDGGAGRDTLIYLNGNRSDFTVTDLSNGQIRIEHDRTADTVSSIERFVFADRTIARESLTFDAILGTPVAVEEPPVVADEPPVIADEPPVVADEPPVIVEEPPVVADEPPVIVDEPPVVADEPPVIVDEPPVVADEPPVIVDEPPVVADEPGPETQTGVTETVSASSTAIEGSDSGEWISGTGGNDHVLAGGGDDEIHDPFGDNIIDGGEGNDALVIYEGGRADFNAYQLSTGQTIVEGPGMNGEPVRHTMTNVERIVFNDGVVEVNSLPMLVIEPPPPVIEPDVNVPSAGILPAITQPTVSGTNGDDWISGTSDNDRILAGQGADSIYAPMGTNMIDAGEGLDTIVLYEGNAAEYSLARTSDGRILLEGPGLNGVPVRNLLANAERILFNDGVIQTADIVDTVGDELIISLFGD